MNILLIGQYAAAISAIIVTASLIVRYLIVTPLNALDTTIAEKVNKQLDTAVTKLEDKIIELTKPIQPNANGGKSLADVHKRIDRLEKNHDQIITILTTPPRRGRPPKN